MKKQIQGPVPIWRYVRDTAVYFLQVLSLTLFIIFFVGRVSIVQGGSMEPRLHTGERIIVNLFIYRLYTPARGDIIVFRYPLDPSKDFIKRVIAVPGEEVEIRQGKVFINGKHYPEPYVTKHLEEDMPPRTVPARHVFVMGDNRENSQDSRSWGPLGFDYIRGKALLVFWPPAKGSLLNH
jgi:signal peptidase I